MNKAINYTMLVDMKSSAVISIASLAIGIGAAPTSTHDSMARLKVSNHNNEKHSSSNNRPGQRRANVPRSRRP